MCAICGCGGDDHHHDGHDHDGHDHHHGHHDDFRVVSATKSVRLEIDLLRKNDSVAAANRAWLESRRILAFNMVSSPGAGKTALLERLIPELSGRSVSVIEGDQETDRDAARIRRFGTPAVQINTGAVCHLDATMVRRGLDALTPRPGSLLFIENVGNLVCPSMFDLGEHARVLVFSVTEGDDKPLKYPHMFKSADALVLNKVDLLPYVVFDVAKFFEYARMVQPSLKTFTTSAMHGDGLSALRDWLSDPGPSRRVVSETSDARA